MAPKYPRDLLLKARIDYETNNFTSVSELATRYNINPKALHSIIERNDWAVKREEVSRELQNKVIESRDNQVQKYLQKSFVVAETYDKLVQVSMQQLSSKDQDGNHIIDPDSLDTYSKISQRSQSMAVIALRIAPVQQVQVSGNLSLSLVSIIQQLRDSKDSTHALPDSSIDRIIDLADDSKP